MGKNLIAVCSFASIIYPIGPSIKLRLKEWDKNPAEYKAGFLVKTKYFFLKNLKTHTSSGRFISYHPLVAPISRRSSNPGVKRRRN